MRQDTTPAQLYAGVFGAVLLIVGIAGFFVLGSDVNILAVNQPDNLLHMVSAAVLLGVGLSRR